MLYQTNKTSTSFIVYSFLVVIILLPIQLRAEDFAFILPARGNVYWKTIGEGIEETAVKQNKSVRVYMGDNDRAAEEQLNLCNIAIEQKPKFLAIAAMNLPVGLRCLKNATEKGILVGEMDSLIPLDKAREAGAPLSFSVGSDNFFVGQTAARYVAEITDKKEARVLIIEGAAGNVNGKARVDGFRSELLKIAPKTVIAGSVSGEWDRLKSMNITTDYLVRDPDINIVYAANDGMALGAVEALRLNGRLKDVAVIGVDGVEDARKSVLKGELKATVAQLPYLVGKRALELGVEVTAGKKVPEREVLDTPVLTKEVLEKKSAPFFQYVR